MSRMSVLQSLVRPNFNFAVDVTVPLSGTTGVYGPSGSGKTTLLRCIAGLEPDAVGAINVGDAVWQDANGRLSPSQRSVGYVFQEPRLFSHLNVQQNIEYGFQRRTGDADIREIATMLGIEALMNRPVADLSGGEAQRVSIARALASAPTILLMDEPLASIDQRRKSDILPFLDRLQASSTLPIIYVSHSLDEICRLCDHLIVLEDGCVTAEGPLQDVLLDADVPALSGFETSAVIDAQVVAFDSDDELTTVRFSGGDVLLSGHIGETGQQIRLRIHANDISLTRGSEDQTTILNRLEVEVEAIHHGEGATRIVRLRAGKEKLLARITRRSVEAMRLAPGEQVTAQLKAVAVRQS